MAKERIKEGVRQALRENGANLIEENFDLIVDPLLNKIEHEKLRELIGQHKSGFIKSNKFYIRTDRLRLPVKRLIRPDQCYQYMLIVPKNSVVKENKTMLDILWAPNKNLTGTSWVELVYGRIDDYSQVFNHTEDHYLTITTPFIWNRQSMYELFNRVGISKNYKQINFNPHVRSIGYKCKDLSLPEIEAYSYEIKIPIGTKWRATPTNNRHSVYRGIEIIDSPAEVLNGLRFEYVSSNMSENQALV